MNDTFNITRKPPDWSAKLTNQNSRAFEDEHAAVMATAAAATSNKNANDAAMNESVLHGATL